MGLGAVEPITGLMSASNSVILPTEGEPTTFLLQMKRRFLRRLGVETNVWYIKRIDN